MTHAVYHAPYACHPDASRGRQHDEHESKTRTPYQRDRDRILHCGAFRRLKHKTQVFVAHVGDYYRTRLTHSLEVAQIGRSIARELGLDEELTETLSLAHDLGHTAFGHAGEDALDAAMQPFGGFDHNAQTLRIVTKLEKRYIQFDGLNMSWETLEGLVKHNGPLLSDGTAAVFSITILPFSISFSISPMIGKNASDSCSEATFFSTPSPSSFHRFLLRALRLCGLWLLTAL